MWRDRTHADAGRVARIRDRALPAGARAVADGDAAAVEAAGAATKSTTASRTTATRSSPNCRASTRSSRRASRAASAPCRRCRRSCAWVRGSAATATAIRLSWPRRSSTRFARRRRGLRALSRTKCIGSAASSRCRRASWSRTPELLALAAAPHDANPHRQDEPYRQALIGIYARLAARRWHAGRDGARRAPHADRPPYATPAPSSSADLDVIAPLARDARRGAARVAAARAAAPRGAKCSAFTWRRSTCARTPTCTKRSSPICSRARAWRPTTSRCRRAARVALLARELASPRPLHSPHLAYAARTARRARDPRRGRRRASQARRRGAAELRHLEMPVGVRSPRSRRAAQGSRAAARRARWRSTSCRCSRRSTTWRDAARSCATRSRCRAIARWLARPRRLAGGDARLLGQQQGRRLSRPPTGRSTAPRCAWSSAFGDARREAAPLPRPRRHGRPRRRPVVRSDPRAAGGQRHRRAAHHRAGRDHRQQVLRPGTRPAQPRSARRGHAGGEPRRRRADRRARGGVPCGAGRARRPSRCARTARSSTRRPSSCAYFRARDADRRDRANSTSAAARRRAPPRRASRTCGRFRGCSAGGSAG